MSLSPSSWVFPSEYFLSKDEQSAFDKVWPNAAYQSARVSFFLFLFLSLSLSLSLFLFLFLLLFLLAFPFLS